MINSTLVKYLCVDIIGAASRKWPHNQTYSDWEKIETLACDFTLLQAPSPTEKSFIYASKTKCFRLSVRVDFTALCLWPLASSGCFWVNYYLDCSPRNIVGTCKLIKNSVIHWDSVQGIRTSTPIPHPLPAFSEKGSLNIERRCCRFCCVMLNT